MENTTNVVANTLIVVPCWNEERRLAVASFERFLTDAPDVGFVFVDDGSTDGTRERLRALEKAAPDRVVVVQLEKNRGKAEAVRQGVLEALRGTPRHVGFWDADLATPLEAILDFRRVLEEKPALEIVIGSRVRMLGREIERGALRHYLGRASATWITLVLGLLVYDTQCGAKLFRNGELLRALFAQPFVSNWLFDVEILARRVALERREGRSPAREAIYEFPVVRWSEVAGSKLRTGSYLRAAIDLLRIRRRYLR